MALGIQIAIASKRHHHDNQDEDGLRGEAKKIALPRELVTWE